MTPSATSETTSATTSATSSATTSATTESFAAEFLPFLLERANILISRPLFAEITRLGFSPPEWRVLATLFDGREYSVGDLADLVLLPQSTVSRTIDKLARQRLVVRNDSGDDRRRTVVTITPRGTTIAGDVVVTATRRQDDVVALLSARQATDLQRTLRRLIDGLSAGQSADPEEADQV